MNIISTGLVNPYNLSLGRFWIFWGRFFKNVGYWEVTVKNGNGKFKKWGVGWLLEKTGSCRKTLEINLKAG